MQNTLGFLRIGSLTNRLPQLRDNELLAAIAAGDRQALEELFLGYHGRLACFLSRCAPRDEDVEEIIDDTFIAVWQNAVEFRYASQASTWIIGVAYHTALKSLKRQKRQFGSAQTVDGQLEQSSDLTEKAETIDLLADGLNRLPLEQRLTLMLAYHMGFSLEEIAAITAAPVEAVNARMFQAREQLRFYTLG
jgi:RNA polymerase sigma-70 factor (ECF subfamily)